MVRGPVARKEKLLTQWKHLLVPMVPVCGLVIALVVGQHDLGTALVLMAVMIGMIWVVGAPTPVVRRGHPWLVGAIARTS